MRPATGRLLSAVLLTLLLAWGALLSAAHMAPSADEMARAQSVLALDAGYESLCDDEAGMGHHCPFCHALPKVEQPRLTGAETRLIFALATPRTGDQVAPALRGARANAPRAPPALPV